MHQHSCPGSPRPHSLSGDTEEHHGIDDDDMPLQPKRIKKENDISLEMPDNDIDP